MATDSNAALFYILLFAGLTILQLVAGRLKAWLRRKRAESWTLVEGHIETHDAQAHTTMKGHTYFDAAVGYSYHFQGEYYSGLHSLGTAGSVEDADTKAEKYAIGMPVWIRANPDRPEESILAEP